MTLSCDELAELTIDYCDGSVAVELRIRIESHLSGCDSCHRHLHGYRSVLYVVRALPKAPPLTTELEQRLRAAVTRQLGE